MRNVSHRSPIAAVKAVISEWKNAHGWSRETVVEQVVTAHMRIDAPCRTGIRFSDHHDPATRQKTNADRVYRWLDDDEDRNLLSVNMLPSVLAGLPVDRAVALVNEILAPAGFAARTLDVSANGAVDPREIVQAIVRTNHRTEADATDLLDGIDPGELPRLHNSLVNDIAVKKSLVTAVESAMRKTGETVTALFRREA
ncbi:hypothetical protein [Paraburkholderia tuberum]|uniref:Bacterial toxin YdaT domain-containing protein n=1 Tax=Paraburkholderia tuberum TaxID=157910 RepID=A0A1H1JS62_9BURK|nr:hypothetical protein [Paraburkholderia tuberum]SDR52752.1 hypothetical protein SAMN05445850_5537 [Paraburkholderia tuberum]